MTQHDIRLVCLDLGGVLIRVCGRWDEACQAAMIDIPDSMRTPHVMKRMIELGQRHERGMISEEQRDIGMTEATGLSPAQITAAAVAVLRGAYPGARELVRWLAAHPNVKSACLTNTSPRHFRMMGEAGPNDLGLHELTWRFTSFEIRRMKPEPAIYEHVARTSALDPSQIIFFDDNPDNVQGARSCGWHAELIDPNDDPPSQVRSLLARYGIT
jgi:FMN phosphatase YigB (HAD superfamily)